MGIVMKNNADYAQIPPNVNGFYAGVDIGTTESRLIIEDHDSARTAILTRTKQRHYSLYDSTGLELTIDGLFANFVVPNKPLTIGMNLPYPARLETSLYPALQRVVGVNGRTDNRYMMVPDVFSEALAIRDKVEDATIHDQLDLATLCIIDIGSLTKIYIADGEMPHEGNAIQLNSSCNEVVERNLLNMLKNYKPKDLLPKTFVLAGRAGQKEGLDTELQETLVVQGFAHAKVYNLGAFKDKAGNAIFDPNLLAAQGALAAVKFAARNPDCLWTYL